MHDEGMGAEQVITGSLPFPVVTLVNSLLTVYFGDELLHGEKAVSLLSGAMQGVSLRV